MNFILQIERKSQKYFYTLQIRQSAVTVYRWSLQKCTKRVSLTAHTYPSSSFITLSYFYTDSLAYIYTQTLYTLVICYTYKICFLLRLLKRVFFFCTIYDDSIEQYALFAFSTFRVLSKRTHITKARYV